MKALIATQKPFAAAAVAGIEDILREGGLETAVLEKYGSQDELAEAVRDADALIIRSDKVMAEIVAAAPKLKIVVRAGAGYDNVDLEACSARGIVVMNTPGQNSNAVAELVFGLLVYTVRNFFNGTSGTELKGKKPAEINKMGVARTFQNIRLFQNLSVLDNVKVGLHNQMKYTTLTGILRLPGYFKSERKMNERAVELLSVFELEGSLDTLASNLPYGKQRKLEIARAIATNPKLLLLDEPAAGMNPNETQELMETIRLIRDRFDLTVLVIEHDMSLVAGICEQITVLNFGTELAKGKTEEVLKDPEVIKAYLGE